MMLPPDDYSKQTDIERQHQINMGATNEADSKAGVQQEAEKSKKSLRETATKALTSLSDNVRSMGSYAKKHPVEATIRGGIFIIFSPQIFVTGILIGAYKLLGFVWSKSKEAFNRHFAIETDNIENHSHLFALSEEKTLQKSIASGKAVEDIYKEKINAQRHKQTEPRPLPKPRPVFGEKKVDHFQDVWRVIEKFESENIKPAETAQQTDQTLSKDPTKEFWDDHYKTEIKDIPIESPQQTDPTLSKDHTEKFWDELYETEIKDIPAEKTPSPEVKTEKPKAETKPKEHPKTWRESVLHYIHDPFAHPGSGKAVVTPASSLEEMKTRVKIDLSPILPVENHYTEEIATKRFAILSGNRSELGTKKDIDGLKDELNKYLIREEISKEFHDNAIKEVKKFKSDFKKFGSNIHREKELAEAHRKAELAKKNIKTPEQLKAEAEEKTAAKAAEAEKTIKAAIKLFTKMSQASETHEPHQLDFNQLILGYKQVMTTSQFFSAIEETYQAAKTPEEKSNLINLVNTWLNSSATKIELNKPEVLQIVTRIANIINDEEPNIIQISVPKKNSKPKGADINAFSELALKCNDDPKEMAKEFHNMFAGILTSITIDDQINAPREKLENPLNLGQKINSDIAHYIGRDILTSEDKTIATKKVDLYLKIAEESIKLRDLPTISAIMLALNHARANEQGLISPEYKNTYEDVVKYCDPSGSSNNARLFIAKNQTTLIPLHLIGSDNEAFRNTEKFNENGELNTSSIQMSGKVWGGIAKTQINITKAMKNSENKINLTDFMKNNPISAEQEKNEIWTLYTNFKKINS